MADRRGRAKVEWRDAGRPNLAFGLEEGDDRMFRTVAVRRKAEDGGKWRTARFPAKRLGDLFRRIERDKALEVGGFRRAWLFKSDDGKFMVRPGRRKGEFKVEVGGGGMHVSAGALRKSVFAVLQDAFDRNAHALTPATRRMVAERYGGDRAADGPESRESRSPWPTDEDLEWVAAWMESLKGHTPGERVYRARPIAFRPEFSIATYGELADVRARDLEGSEEVRRLAPFKVIARIHRELEKGAGPRRFALRDRVVGGVIKTCDHVDVSPAEGGETHIVEVHDCFGERSASVRISDRELRRVVAAALKDALRNNPGSLPSASRKMVEAMI